MVRSIAGILIRIGEGALSPDALLAIRNSGVRTARVPTAPSKGLFLWRVGY
jgi:tRNA U38,U39,U40 pseudouridine synthase TruA